MKTEILEWFANGERGSSSEAIACVLAGIERKEYDNHPYDPSDLRRCMLLLDAVHGSREHLDKVAQLSGSWAALIENWSELENLLREEMAAGNRAPKTYTRMKEILNGVTS